MSKREIPTRFFALVVVRRGDRFLLVHERKHGQSWYLPGGRAEPGEALAETALRETLEETGIPIRLVGLLRVEHSASQDCARVRALFLGEPLDERPPKSKADEESLSAAWVALPELADHPLRGHEVEELLRYVAGGGAVYPLSLLQREGAPFTPQRS